MDNTEFDTALVSAAFTQAGLTGWRVEAARSAELPLDQARARFPGPGAVLMRFGLMADAAALAEIPTEPAVRDRLFDLLMRRFDVLQRHRQGMLALLQTLPADPLLSLALGAATLRSMAWMLEAAGVSAAGLRGKLRAQGLVAVWLYALRAWKTDDSTDLAGTMAALDKALDQAERFSSMLGKDEPTPVPDVDLAAAFDVPPEDVAESETPEGPDSLTTSNPPPPPPDVPPPSPF
jgi:hypothetical protein